MLRLALEPLAARLSSALVDAASFSAICNAAEFFPHIERCLLECEISTSSANADFSICFHQRETNTVLKDFWRGRDLANAGWVAGILALCAAWAQDPSLKNCKEIWLELDTSAGATQVVPSVFLGFYGPGAASQNSDRFRMFSTAVGKLCPNTPLSLAAAQNVVDRIADASPIVQTGLMLSRAGTPVRLCLRCASPSAAAHLLDRLGLAERKKAVLDLFEPAARLGFSVAWLHIEISDHIHHRIGLDFFSPESHKSNCRAPAQPLLDDWLARGWCTPGKYEALRPWCEGGSDRLAGLEWSLGYLKLISDADAITAKAYLKVRGLPPLAARY